MALQFIITNAGRAAIAQVGGAIGPVTLTKIAIGNAGYTPTASRTSLQTEIKRLDPSGSSVPVPGTIHLTAQDDSADSYSVKEIGLYTNNNVLFAVYSQTGVILTKGSTASALFALDFVMTNVPAGTVVVGDAGFSYAQANETRLGVLAIATTAEAQAGTVDTKIITPLKLAQVTATESRRGVIALATTAEAQALAPDATKALTVARLVDRTATTGRAGVVVLASSPETQTGTDANKAVTPAGLKSTLGGYSASSHTHDDRYYTESEMNTLLAGKQASGSYAAATHTHDDRYYTESEVNSLLAAKQNSLGFTPVQQGGGANQGTNKLFMGWSSDSQLRLQIDSTDFGPNWPINVTGTASGNAPASHTHDDRYYTETEMNTLLAGKQAAGSYAPSTGIAQSAVTNLTTDLAGKAASSHTHAASAITSGTIDNARLNAATTSVAGIVELATSTETQTGTDATRAVTPAALASVTALLVPPGAVLPFAMNVVPSGWLAANGAAVSRTLYPALFASIGTLYGAGDGSTTFALPDLRGYFVRGQGTNSDGTAAGAFGTRQADDFKSHNHTGSTSQNGSHNHTYNSHTATFSLQGGSSGGAFQNIMRNPDGNGQTSTVGNHSHTITAEGGTENRPRNIALLYCIKF